MMVYLKLFLIALPIFAALDFIWLGLIMSNYYQSQLSTLGRYVNGALQPNWISALLAYLCLAAGLVFFVVATFIGKEIGWDVLLRGALFGLVIYGVYEFSNHAVLKDWPVGLVIVDTAWGVVIYALAGYFTAMIARWFEII